MMLTGVEVVFVAAAGLVILWAIILYGSTFFGSK
jgi:hypothetical protein